MKRTLNFKWLLVVSALATQSYLAHAGDSDEVQGQSETREPATYNPFKKKSEDHPIELHDQSALVKKATPLDPSKIKISEPKPYDKEEITIGTTTSKVGKDAVVKAVAHSLDKIKTKEEKKIYAKHEEIPVDPAHIHETYLSPEDAILKKGQLADKEFIEQSKLRDQEFIEKSKREEAKFLKESLIIGRDSDWIAAEQVKRAAEREQKLREMAEQREEDLRKAVEKRQQQIAAMAKRREVEKTLNKRIEGPAQKLTSEKFASDLISYEEEKIAKKHAVEGKYRPSENIVDRELMEKRKKEELEEERNKISPERREKIERQIEAKKNKTNKPPVAPIPRLRADSQNIKNNNRHTTIVEDNLMSAPSKPETIGEEKPAPIIPEKVKAPTTLPGNIPPPPRRPDPGTPVKAQKEIEKAEDDGITSKPSQPKQVPDNNPKSALFDDIKKNAVRLKKPEERKTEIDDQSNKQSAPPVDSIAEALKKRLQERKAKLQDSDSENESE